MELPTREHTLLDDLALVYLALVRDAGRDATRATRAALARRLARWDAAAGTDAVDHALGRAADTLRTADAEARVQQAVGAVGARLPRPQLQRLVDDLVEAGLADGALLAEESRFIGQLVKAWGVHGPEASAARWSILRSADPAGPSPLHGLGLVYLALAHQADHDIVPAELEAIGKKLKEWVPDARPHEVDAVVQEVLRRYAAGPADEVVAEAVEVVRQAVPAHQRAALVADLHYVARADGVMLVEEKEIIARLARAWGVPLRASAPDASPKKQKDREGA